MKTTDDLKQEHTGIKLMLNILGKISDDIAAGKALNTGHFESILEFLQVFVDKCHHGKEEDLLLPAMVKAGVPKEKGVIKFTLMEHTEGRGYIKGMSEAFDKLREGGRQSSTMIIENANNYIGLLVRHIDKEEKTLFPMADKVLSKAKQGELDKEFEELEVERIGLGKHEEFHKLLHQLKEIYLD